MQVVRAKFKLKMRGDRAKKCNMVEQKLNKKCEVVEQKNAKPQRQPVLMSRACSNDATEAQILPQPPALLPQPLL
jgi:hypothetical protein